MAEDAERRARMSLSCALDGGDPLVVELVARHGPEGAWTRILNGALGEPTAERAACLSLESVDRLADRAGARFLIPGDDEWPTGLAGPGPCRGDPAARR